jgi:tetratricopeptide (TPR) repeat protein
MKLSIDSETKGMLAAGLVVLLAVLAAYSNHFRNDFHFDDSHTVINNVYVRDPGNIPRFFTDAQLFSSLRDHQVYQPVTIATLAVDYWLSGGPKPGTDKPDPLWFHISTFTWFLVMLVLLFFVFRRIMDSADANPANIWFALLAVACFGLHPAIAETVNYIIQRADLYSTLGVVAGLFLYVRFPALRKWGLYLVPAVIGMLAKAPALIFPVILIVYVYLFEMDGSLSRDAAGTWAENGKKWVRALIATLPAFAVTIGMSVLILAMKPSTFTPGAASPGLYWITQPFVTLHYFKSFFLPTELSADTDWTVVHSFFSLKALIGLIFVVGLIVLAVRASRQQVFRPISFGILWFLLALIPTAVTPLAEVTNDHRMFFPFIGLALAAAWGFRFLWFQSLKVAIACTLAVVCILIIAGFGTWQRNRVWHTDESLWQDVTVKSPNNSRGLMNYGLTQMEKGQLETALDYFQRALPLAPNYSVLEINLGIVNGALGRDAEAERHFQRAITLAASTDAGPHFYYGRWLKQKGKVPEGIAQMKKALVVNPDAFDARHLLMQIYFEQGNLPDLEHLAKDTLQRDRYDATAQQFLSPEGLLSLSVQDYNAGKFPECIRTAQWALRLKPDYPEAYNNMAAGYNSLGFWDKGIEAANEAIRLKPDFELAKNNLAWAMTQKQQASAVTGTTMPDGTPSPTGTPGPAGAPSPAGTPAPTGRASAMPAGAGVAPSAIKR